MGALTFDTLFRSLKRGAPDPTYYLYGDEDVLKDEAVRAIADRAMAEGGGLREFNVDVRSATDLDAEAFEVLVNTLPLLAGTRVVVVRSLEQVRKNSRLHKAVAAYLAAPNPSTVLILVQGGGGTPDETLLRNATAVALESLPPERVARWGTRRAAELGL